MTSIYETADGITYFNINMQTSSGQTEQSIKSASIQASFNQNLNTAIVSDASQYDLAITRFSISTQSIPIFVCPIQLGGNDNVNLTYYSFQMSLSGFQSGEVFMQFQPQQTIPRPKYPGQNNGLQDFSTGYYNVFNIQWVINMINETLRTCILLLISEGAVIDITTQIPYFVYNTSTTCLDLIGTLDLFVTKGCQLYCNKQMYQLIGSQFTVINFNDADGRNYLLDIKPQPVGVLFTPSDQPVSVPPKYILMAGDKRTIDTWSPLSKIIFTSSTLPTQGEFIQPATFYGGSLNPSQNNIAVSSKIITDFEPDFYNNIITDRNFIQYNATGVANYRLIKLDCSRNFEIRQINISTWWMDVYGNVYPLMLNNNTGLTMKMAFIPKSYFKFR